MGYNRNKQKLTIDPCRLSKSVFHDSALCFHLCLMLGLISQGTVQCKAAVPKHVLLDPLSMLLGSSVIVLIKFVDYDEQFDERTNP